MKLSHLAAAALSVAMMGSAFAEVSKKDQDFLTKAAAGGMYEVEAGKLAQQKGTAPEVKSYGEMLVKDHSAANEELKGLAGTKGVALPAALPTDKQARLDKIGRAKAFDKEFLKEVGLDDHKKDISLFEKASKSADDADVKAFATKTLPVLKAHREHADGLRKSMK
jgi:putative membrane protein